MKRYKYFLLALITLSLSVSEFCAVNFKFTFLGSTAVAQSVNDRKVEADRLLKQGIKQYSISQFQNALRFWKQSLAIYRDIGNRQGIAASLNNLGGAYYSLGDYHKAIDYHQQALEIEKQIGNREGIATSLNNLGAAYKNLGNYRKAIDYYQQVLVIDKQIGNRSSVANSLNNLGAAYFKLGDYRKAIDYYEQTLVIHKQIKNIKGVANSLNNLGSVYSLVGDSRKAIDYHQQALVMDKRTGNIQAQANTLANIGTIYLGLKEYKKAYDYFETSLAITEKIEDKDTKGKALKGKAKALHKQGVKLRDSGKLTEATEKLFYAIKVHEESRKLLGNNDSQKISLFDKQYETYKILKEVLILSGRTTDSLIVSDKSHYPVLTEILLERSSKNTQKETQIKNLVYDDIQQVAQQQNATLVQYSVTTDEIYIWVVSPQGKIQLRAVNLPKNISLKKLVKITRDSIGVRGRNNNNPLVKQDNPTSRLKQLHQLLISPIADLLPKDEQQRVIFIPHQELFLVPFVALQDKNNKYLIEKHTILTAPSIQTLSLNQKDKQSNKNLNASILSRGEEVLIIGNPTMPKSGVGKQLKPLSNLKGAEREAKNIARMLNTKAIIGDEATESTIVQKMPSAKLIHLATHGLIDSINAIGSPGAIALAPDDKNDGFLTTSEIMERFGLPGKSRLNADLIVLSACDTGRGDIKGEGVIGLSRAFMASGVPTLVVSVWKVPDDETVKLMTEFYTNIYEHKFDKAKAMREAMLTMLNDDDGNPDPKAWAAFTVIGKAE